MSICQWLQTSLSLQLSKACAVFEAAIALSRLNNKLPPGADTGSTETLWSWTSHWLLGAGFQTTLEDPFLNRKSRRCHPGGTMSLYGLLTLLRIQPFSGNSCPNGMPNGMTRAAFSVLLNTGKPPGSDGSLAFSEVCYHKACCRRHVIS